MARVSQHRAMRFRDLTNQRFGNLVAAWPEGRLRSAAIWLCICDCGAIAHTAAAALLRGQKSCGCRTKSITHGMSYSSEYASYRNAKYRCTNPSSQAWSHYGGRGIQFLFTSFEQLIEEIGHRPSKEHSLDRIDNDGNYEPGNVRWATASTQAFNRRKHV